MRGSGQPVCDILKDAQPIASGHASCAGYLRREEQAMTTAAISNEIRETIVSTLRRHDVVHAGIFGSVARGDQTAQSDLDLLIEFDPTKTKSLLDLAALGIELEDALGRSVDLVTYRSLSPRIRDRVLAEEVVLL
jgi:predicted nucleotidyltransferase